MAQWKELSGKRSDVWNHFLVNSDNDSLVKCKYCSAKFNLNNCSTSPLIYHLEKKENIKLKSKDKETNENIQSRQMTIQACFQKKDPPELVLARLVALDSLPFYKLEKSRDIQNLFRGQGLKVPSSRQGMRAMFVSYAEKMKGMQKSALEKMAQNGQRFSLSLDEWTSTKIKRYMCVNLHLNESKVISLGMKRINGSMKAEDAVMIIQEKLSQFGLNLNEHIVGIVTDGAAVMEKTGRLSQVLHQTCHSHGIHLSVVDVLYKKKNNTGEQEDESVDDKAIHEDTANEEWDDDSVQITWEESMNDNELDFELSDKVEKVINKIRTVVRLFRRSPVKNDVLQKNCQAEFGKELNLIMDTRIRWNSLLKMLSRFLEIRTAVEKTLKDLDHGSKCLDEYEVSLTKDLKETLEIIEVGATALSRRDVTVLKSDKIFEFIIQKLSQETGQIAGEMLTAVFRRIESRRNKNICGLIRYLESPQNYDQISQQSQLEYPRKKELPKVARDLFVRLFPNEAMEENETGNLNQPPVKRTKAEELNDILSKHSGMDSASLQTKDILTHIKKEMTFFEATQECPKALKMLKNCLDTLPPSSVEAERCFSAAGLFVTKLRSSLSDYMIDILCFMRSHLQQ